MNEKLEKNENKKTADVLRAENLVRDYVQYGEDGEKKKEIHVLKGLNFSIQRQEFVGIMGRSGCGKTTFLKLLGMIDRQTGGKLFFEEHDTEDLWKDEFADVRQLRRRSSCSLRAEDRSPGLLQRVLREDARERLILPQATTGVPLGRRFFTLPCPRVVDSPCLRQGRFCRAESRTCVFPRRVVCSACQNCKNWILRHHSAFFPPYRAVKHKRESRRFPSRRKQQWTERNRLPP